MGLGSGGGGGGGADREDVEQTDVTVNPGEQDGVPGWK